MGEYMVQVNATAHATTGSEDTWIELLAPANTCIMVRRIKFSRTHTTVSDEKITLRLKRVSAAGSGGTSGTIVKADPKSPTPGTTATIKNGTTNFTTGTLLNVIMQPCISMRGSFEWIAKDFDDLIWSEPGGRIAIALVSTSGASQVLTAEVDFVE